MRIAIFGATSQIAKDFIFSSLKEDMGELSLFARRPQAVSLWMAGANISKRCKIADFSQFNPTQSYDVIINFVGSGNPAQTALMGSSIFDITFEFDKMVLEYLPQHPDCRYIFLSSGAVYGTGFDEPANQNDAAKVEINNFQPQNWYAAAKLYAECRHRALPNLSIVDLRVFNYFSHTQDLSARFFITDALRAIREEQVLQTSSAPMVRDYLGPDDLFQLINRVLSAPAANDVLDCYTLAPVDKITLLAELQNQFGLQYKVCNAPAGVNATGVKSKYYSMSKKAETYGYRPTRDSLQTVISEYCKTT